MHLSFRGLHLCKKLNFETKVIYNFFVLIHQLYAAPIVALEGSVLGVKPSTGVFMPIYITMCFRISDLNEISTKTPPYKKRNHGYATVFPVNLFPFTAYPKSLLLWPLPVVMWSKYFTM